ncbi:UDP-galactopyranose mutase [Hyphomicrobium sp. 99]|uniref:UDP-galactopyranose mutase n=1 Tax=Hyphomicrobium sp. 99 TaxID=1163419 RepID=UPI001FD945F6|nr:UDP-galactopyranose mutase [Hyphomicrobium sp. 99]
MVGAGFAGAVHARELAEAGFEVDVIDKRSHIAGNCYDYVHSCGVRVHKYGPHLFHTSNQKVIDWLSRFTGWLPYEHRVAARLPDERLAPLPVNLDTVNIVFRESLSTPEEVASLLASKVLNRNPILSAEDHLYTHIGPDLTNLFFRPYSLKMWAMDLSETDASVVRRLEIRMDRDDRYFPNDTFQAMPSEGFTRLFERILDHDRIHVRLGESFSADVADAYDECFNSMPIDEFFGFDLGELPYRSIRFHLNEHAAEVTSAPYAVINYTDHGPFTRETWWHRISGHHVRPGPTVLRTVEEPCDYRDNGYERYYPVKTRDGRYDALYRQYAERISSDKRMHFIGRCGTYQYLDMHQVINQSLAHVGKWLERARHDTVA